MWRLLRNRRLILRLHYFQVTHILDASRGGPSDSMASCYSCRLVAVDWRLTDCSNLPGWFLLIRDVPQTRASNSNHSKTSTKIQKVQRNAKANIRLKLKFTQKETSIY